ncbi:MAG: ATP-dependent DNA helicase [Nakamurella sp.]
MTSYLIEAMNAAVVAATGNPAAKPRPAQLLIAQEIEEAMRTKTHVVAQAPTGSGKSIAGMVPAALQAAIAGERTVVSTESLSLQAQYAEKDLPVVAAAVAHVTGKHISFAVLKGWSNYSCALDAVHSARIAAGLDPEAPIPITEAGLRKFADDAEKAVESQPLGTRVSGRGDQLVDSRELVEAAAWGVRATADQRVGDRHSYPGAVAGPVWDAVSVSASDCMKERCPLLDLCLPAKAKRKAAAADIVVTNHTLLGIQAAKNVPVVMSSKSLGQFHHVVVDEAHGLPSIVRDQGATAVSGRQVDRLRSAASRVVDEWAKSATPRKGATKEVSAQILKIKAEQLKYLAAGMRISDDLARELTAFRDAGGSKPIMKLAAEDNPIATTAAAVTGYLAVVRQVMKTLEANGGSMTISRDVARIRTRCANLASAVTAVSTHEVGVARWVEYHQERGTIDAKATPVQIGPMLAGAVWVTEEIPTEEELMSGKRSIAELTDEANSTAEGKPKVPLSVTMLSATLPVGFSREVALSARLQRFPTPLDEAYERSVLHIPKMTDTDIRRLSNPYETKQKFDTKAHAAWAVGKVVELVEANAGSALVLSATAAGGRVYAEQLRMAAGGRWKVLSQWDGRLPSAVAADWRADHSSVLVGTRSFMTGLDAPGATCSLVILDRPPRAAGNPVDDARVEMLTAGGSSRWDADTKVYVSDAVVLLAQAVGRLLRSVDDQGMVVVLDPRMLKNNPFSYNEATRTRYMAAVAEFGRKISDPAKALDWLRTSRAARPAA